MSHPRTWNPYTDWKHVDVKWIKIDISKEDLKRFTTRSNFKGLCQTVGFLIFIAATGAFAYWAFAQKHWIVLAIALYIHGTFYKHFGTAIHELGHNCVFASRAMNRFFVTLYGLIYWPQNPYLYHLSHQNFHHRYTLYQNSDGEDTPNYVEITPKLIFDLFFRCVEVREFLQCAARLFTLKPTSKGWRASGYKLDTWERFILEKATDKQRRQVHSIAISALIFQVVFVAVCVYFGLWFLPVLITLAPFYGGNFHVFICGVHQHAACEANCPDFKISCGSSILDPISSFIYWHMEHHIEHHMYAGIPCYNLKAFSRFVADQLPPKEYSIPRIVKINKICKEKYGSWQNWRDNFGRYKGY